MPSKPVNSDFYENDQVDQFLTESITVNNIEIRHTLSKELQLEEIEEYIQDFSDEPDEEMVFAIHMDDHYVGIRLFQDQNQNKFVQYIDPLGQAVPADLNSIFSNANLNIQVLKTKIQHSTQLKVTNNHCGPFVVFLISGLTNGKLQLNDQGHIWLNDKRIPNLNYSESNQLGLSIRAKHQNLEADPEDLLTQIQLKNHYSAALYHDVIYAEMKKLLMPNLNAVQLRSQKILPTDISAVGNIVVAYVELEVQFSHPIGATRLTFPIDTGNVSFNSSNNKNLSITFQESYNDDKKIGGTGKPNQKHFHSEPMLFQYLKSDQGLNYISEQLKADLKLLNNEDLKLDPKFNQNKANKEYLEKLRAAKEIKLLSVDHVGVYIHTTQSMCTTCQDAACGDEDNPGFEENYAPLIENHVKTVFQLPNTNLSISYHPGYTTPHISPQKVPHVSRDGDLKASPLKPSKYNIGIVSEVVPYSPPRTMDHFDKGEFNFNKSSHTFFSNKGSNTHVKKAYISLDYKKVMGNKEELNARRAASRMESAFLHFKNKKLNTPAIEKPSTTAPKIKPQ